MTLPKYVPCSSAPHATPYMASLIALGIVLLGLMLPAEGQIRTRTRNPTRFDDVVFGISFSPDGRTLAIARGAGEPIYRYGRIELWDIEKGKLRHLIKGFDGPVRSISFSPDGQTLISSSTEFRTSRIQQKARSREGVTRNELKWWNTQTGELRKKVILPREDSFSIKATQSPDGKHMVLSETFREQYLVNLEPMSGPANSRVGNPSINRPFYRSTLKVEMKLVDPQTGDRRVELDMSHPGALSFSPDSHLLAVANYGEVKLWDPQNGKELRKLKGLRGVATALAFSPNGRSLAVASIKYEREYTKQAIKIMGFSEVKVFEVNSGKVSQTLKDLGAVNSLAFSSDGRILVVGGVLPAKNGGTAGMKLIDVQTGKVDDFPTGADYNEAVDSLVLSGNGSLLAFRSGPATVKLLDTHKGVMKQTFDADSVGDDVERPTSRFLLSIQRVLAVTFSADGLTVFGESDQGEIKAWDRRTGEVKRRLSIEQDNPLLVAASRDGKFAEVSQEGLLLWDANDDTKRRVPLGPQTVSALALSADGNVLAVGSGGEVTLLSPTGEVVKKLTGPEGSVTRLAFSNDGRMLACTDEDGTIRIWSLASGQVEKTLMTNSDITALVFAPDGEMLATAAQDNTISLWKLQTGLPEKKFQKHDATINALAFSPNGQWLASGGDDRTIIIWELAAGKSKRTLKGHDQTVTSLAFSPDGGLLATGSGNASVVLWEVGTGRLSRVLR